MTTTPANTCLIVPSSLDVAETTPGWARFQSGESGKVLGDEPTRSASRLFGSRGSSPHHEVPAPTAATAPIRAAAALYHDHLVRHSGTDVARWDRQFESSLLQRRVRCEPDFPIRFDG
jgi:hypothetical protein